MVSAIRLLLLRVGCSRIFVTAVAVLIWTIICLAIAAHFQSILQASDLSEYPCSSCGGLSC